MGKGRIAVKFDGLCIFFQDGLSRRRTLDPTTFMNPALTVGVLKVDGKENCSLSDNAPWCNPHPDDVHIPTISIYEIELKPTLKKIPIPDFTNRVLSGDMYFQATGPGASPVKLSTSSNLNTLGARLSLVKDIQNSALAADFPTGAETFVEPFQLVRAQDLPLEGASQSHPKPLRQRCAARLHFNTGVLFSLGKLPHWPFAEPVHGADGKPTVGSITHEIGSDIQEHDLFTAAGLEMSATPPKTLFNVTLASDCTRIFHFNPNKDYEIFVTSNGQNSNNGKNHYLYYYSVFQPQPLKFITPVVDPENPSGGEPWCSPMGAP